MKDVVLYIYCLPIQITSIVMISSVLVWTMINKKFGLNERNLVVLKYANMGLLMGNILAILYTTILTREVREREICLVPLYSFFIAQEQPEMYRSMLMNVLLFVPFGIFLPYAQKEMHKGKIKVTILSAFVFTVVIEVLQYIFMLGRAEVDDVICNTLGALIGSLSFALYRMLEKKKNKI